MGTLGFNMGAKRKSLSENSSANELHCLSEENPVAIPRADSLALKSQGGFALVFLLAFLPLLLTGCFALLFSQFLFKNWMESLQICRTELLNSQKRTATQLEALIKLNPLAANLRTALLNARIQLAAAIASKNFPLAAKIQADIIRIEKQRSQLDQHQKSLIRLAEQQMSSGVDRVRRRLRSQDQTNQSRASEFFSSRLQGIQTRDPGLAVQPDQPDTAPVYELRKPFEENQALSVSWRHEFQTRKPEKYKWIQNRHKKQNQCSASLRPAQSRFREVLTADKFFLKH